MSLLKQNIQIPPPLSSDWHPSFFFRGSKFFQGAKRGVPPKNFAILFASVSRQSDPNEMWSKLKKLSNPPSSKAVLEIVREDGTISNDVKEVLKRWHEDIGKLFSGLRENPEFAFDNDFYEEIIEKKNEFENLAPEQQDQQSDFNSGDFNKNISYDEVSRAIDKWKLKKAYIEIPKTFS